MMKWRVTDLDHDTWQLVDDIGAVHAEITRTFEECVEYPLPEYSFAVFPVYDLRPNTPGRKPMEYPGMGGYCRTAEGCMLMIEDWMELTEVEVIDG